MNKKTFSTLGMIFSAVIVFLGILVLAGALGGDASYPNSASYLYDSGYATFGGDFYTFVNNNAAEAASASYTAAANLQDLCELLKNVCGIFLMGFGLMGVCYFGIQRCKYTEDKKTAENSAPAEPEVVAEAEASDEPEVLANTVE